MFAVTFDPTEVVMINPGNGNQIPKKSPKDEWSYELFIYMYIKLDTFICLKISRP